MTKKSFKKADPNYQKELAKYGNPIPSRDYILQIIRENNAPMSREEILTALSIKSDEQQEAMRRRLRAMENDGQLVFTKRKRYALPEKLDLFKGMVIGHREGYGFLQVEGKKEDLFIPNHQMQRVMHGDFVLAQPAGLDRRGRREVRIVRVLESRKKQIVGRFFLENGFMGENIQRKIQSLIKFLKSDQEKTYEWSINKATDFISTLGDEIVVAQLRLLLSRKQMRDKGSYREWLEQELKKIKGDEA